MEERGDVLKEELLEGDSKLDEPSKGDWVLKELFHGERSLPSTKPDSELRLDGEWYG